MSAEMTITVHRVNLLTANQRLHWARKAAIVRVLRHAGAINARAQGIPVMERAHLTVHITWPDRRRRDASNLAPTIKALVDGIVSDAHRLPDDDDQHLTGPDYRVTPETTGIKGVTGLRFVFTEYQEGGVKC